jgi:hypothetical protein
MVVEGYNELDRRLLSYDVRGIARPVASRVCHIVFGRVRRNGGGIPRERIEKGFIHRPGVVWIGQSVLVLPPRDAEELSEKLRALGVRVVQESVGISVPSLKAFQRLR